MAIKNTITNIIDPNQEIKCKQQEESTTLKTQKTEEMEIKTEQKQIQDTTKQDKDNNVNNVIITEVDKFRI